MLQLEKLLMGVLFDGKTRFVLGSKTERLAVGHSLFSSCSRLRRTDRRCLVVCGRTLSQRPRDCHTMVPILVVLVGGCLPRWSDENRDSLPITMQGWIGAIGSKNPIG